MEGEGIIATFLTFVAITILCLALWGCPQWNVYQSRLSGEAQLAEAESNRKIAIAEAEAKKESAEALAEAEIIRAKGEAETNCNKVIYIPTEAGLPILEAGRNLTR